MPALPGIHPAPITNLHSVNCVGRLATGDGDVWMGGRLVLEEKEKGT